MKKNNQSAKTEQQPNKNQTEQTCTESETEVSTQGLDQAGEGKPDIGPDPGRPKEK